MASGSAPSRATASCSPTRQRSASGNALTTTAAWGWKRCGAWARMRPSPGERRSTSARSARQVGRGSSARYARKLRFVCLAGHQENRPQGSLPAEIMRFLRMLGDIQSTRSSKVGVSVLLTKVVLASAFSCSSASGLSLLASELPSSWLPSGR